MSAVPLAQAFADTGLNNFDFRPLTPGQRLHWAHERYAGALAATSSFGVRSILLIDQLHKAGLLPHIPIVSVDIMGPEWDAQRAYRERLQDIYGFTLHLFPATGEDGKTRAMRNGLQKRSIRATLDGIHAWQTENRARKPFVEPRPGHTAIHPLLDWPEAKADWYIENTTPKAARHPDWAPGARSTGGILLPNGAEKTECGLHV